MGATTNRTSPRSFLWGRYLTEVPISDESDAAMEHPKGATQLAVSLQVARASFIEPAKIKQKKLNSNA